MNWGIDNKKIRVIHNWAPVQDIPVYPKCNPWSISQNIAGKFCIMYTGSLGMKHNPNLLFQLACHYRNDNKTCIYVISEGLGAEWLKSKKEEVALPNLMILPYQPFDQMPLVMSSSDILIAVLNPEASIFSVPSKVLTYLCAKRPLVLAVPQENLAARIVTKNQAGYVVPPMNIKAITSATDKLIENPSIRHEFGDNARSYAELHFNIQNIGDKFEKLMY
jgi:glycosyltransferase involved in cell wall biosynthesis